MKYKVCSYLGYSFNGFNFVNSDSFYCESFECCKNVILKISLNKEFKKYFPLYVYRKGINGAILKAYYDENDELILKSIKGKLIKNSIDYNKAKNKSYKCDSRSLYRIELNDDLIDFESLLPNVVFENRFTFLKSCLDFIKNHCRELSLSMKYNSSKYNVLSFNKIIIREYDDVVC